MAEKKFLAIGDLLFNPDLLAYATFDDDDAGPRLRLGFATSTGASAKAEVRLSGEEASAAVRWLRLNATPLTRAGAFGPLGRAIEGSSPGPAAEGRAVDPVVRAMAR